MRHCVGLAECHDRLEFLLVQIHQFDLVLVRQRRVAKVLEGLRGGAGGRLGNDGVVELPDGLEKLQNAGQSIGVRGGKLVGRGNVVGLDDHPAIADGLGDLLFQRLQGPKDIVGAIVAVGQRDLAGRRGSGRSRLWRYGCLRRGAGRSRRAGKAPRKQRGGARGESGLQKKVTTIGERELLFSLINHGAILLERGPDVNRKLWLGREEGAGQNRYHTWLFSGSFWQGFAILFPEQRRIGGFPAGSECPGRSCAPVTPQNMPDCLSLRPMTVLQPASITPEPMNRPRARYSA